MTRKRSAVHAVCTPRLSASSLGRLLCWCRARVQLREAHAYSRAVFQKLLAALRDALHARRQRAQRWTAAAAASAPLPPAFLVSSAESCQHTSRSIAPPGRCTCEGCGRVSLVAACFAVMPVARLHRLDDPQQLLLVFLIESVKLSRVHCGGVERRTSAGREKSRIRTSRIQVIWGQLVGFRP